MIRVVLDTNILISALLSPLGPPAQVFLMTLLDPDTQLCVSGEIYAEYEEVVRRPRSIAATAKSKQRFAPFVRRASGLSPPRGCAPVLIPMMTFFWNAHRLLERII